MVPGSVCLEETFLTNNTSVNGSDFLWDFCGGGLSTIPAGNSVVDISAAAPVGLTIVHDSSFWYGFVTARTSNQILRVDIGAKLTNPVDLESVVDLGNVGGILNGPEGIAFHQEGGNWYGLVANYSANNLIRIDFGASLTNPTP